MNITINKDTPIEQLIEYLKVNQRLTDIIANSLRLNFKTIGDIYNVSYKDLMQLPGISYKYPLRLAINFLVKDYINFKNCTLLISLVEYTNSEILHWHGILHSISPTLLKEYEIWSTQNYNEYIKRHCSSIDLRLSSFVEFLDELNQQSIQETSTTKQPQQTDDKSFRLIQKLLEIWNDDVEQQVEDIINQSR